MSSLKTEVELKARSCHKHSNTAVKQPAKKLRADSPNRFKFNRVLNIRNKQTPVPHPKHSVELVVKQQHAVISVLYTDRSNAKLTFAESRPTPNKCSTGRAVFVGIINLLQELSLS